MNIVWRKEEKQKDIGDGKRSGRTPTLQGMYQFVETDFGEMLLAATPTGLCYAEFIGANVSGRKKAVRTLKQTLSCIDMKEGTNLVLKKALKYVKGENVDFDIHVSGTEFQIAVWSSLLTIPRGFLSVYQTVAKRIGKPKAVRAVASAIAKNQIALFIPCHRVVRSDGTLGEYRWGVDRKIKIIESEAKFPKGGTNCREGVCRSGHKTCGPKCVV